MLATLEELKAVGDCNEEDVARVAEEIMGEYAVTDGDALLSCVLIELRVINIADRAMWVVKVVVLVKRSISHGLCRGLASVACSDLRDEGEGCILFDGDIA